MKRIVSIYKSSKTDELYVYVDKKDGWQRVPDALSDKFGQRKHVVDMLLTPEKNLARAKAEDVLAAIDKQGFYLQMPPAKEEYMLDLHKDTSFKYQGLD